jgi:hypothetical protein
MPVSVAKEITAGSDLPPPSFNLSNRDSRKALPH